MSKLRSAPASGPVSHYIASAATVVLVLAVAAAAVQAFGDPRAATPRAVASLDVDLGPDEPLRAPLSEVIVDPSIDAEEADALDPAFPEDGAQPLPEAAPRPTPLARAPLPGFTQPGPMGPLPIIGPGGRTPMEVYKRPFTGDPDKPSIAIVVGGLGFSARATQAAIDELPAEVTLAFMPYSDDLQTWVDRARADGHEVLLEIPMEPFDQEASDTGPQTLLTNAAPRENLARLENLLSRAAGYFGVINYQGGRFATSTQASAPVAEALKGRGLALVGSGIGQRTGLAAEARRQGAPYAGADRILDVRRDADAIDEQLLTLEALALENGAALGTGFAYPVTISQVARWAEDVRTRGYQLAPASAVVARRSAAR